MWKYEKIVYGKPMESRWEEGRKPKLECKRERQRLEEGREL